ncbi:two-component sensor histidine kinase [Sphaerisporangium melleum]|uniref:histidine kinase n=1 Tax=Sphaerisporangium melleum TaxID=321316 RepID=A0A917R3B5_9ACTN|nr:histidine kinase [Sphaerisporangium melleum]GGK86365.1 two-component sensor histidine kinase [Sphaerisporangium melleum]GII71499.1 two-component sensor histidine kinase [Sphaerisporangium melleum]
MIGEVRAWAAGKGRAADLLVFGSLLLICLTAARNFDGASAPPHARALGLTGYLVMTGLLLLPLLWRRRHPVPAFAAVALISFVQWVTGVQPIPANVTVLVALYAVASACALRWSVTAGAIAELGIVLLMARYGGLSLYSLASGSVFVAATWIAGIYASTRRRYLEGLEERAERAERERDQQVRIAAAAERARIARELHDVVAHNVSVMIVQADGAAYAIDGDPEQARRAMRTISGTGRQALAEMRRLVGVLRKDDAGEEEYAPQPGVADLDDLLAHFRQSGLPVEYAVTGVRRDLPEGVQLAIYRIVQEALTNTLKHGGPKARAGVEMDYGPHEIHLRVSDDGRGAAAPRSIDGHGLIGMRERVAMYDGSVQASPSPGGGFQVTVRLPLARAA